MALVSPCIVALSIVLPRKGLPIIEGKGPLMLSLYVRLTTLFPDDDDGQGLAEYALILALIAIVAIIALIFLGGQVSKILSNVGKSV
jgi:Flp pilus assembly pilin Flp